LALGTKAKASQCGNEHRRHERAQSPPEPSHVGKERQAISAALAGCLARSVLQQQRPVGAPSAREI